MLFKLDFFFFILPFPFYFATAEMLAELVRREKEANIKPDSDVDIYMKVGRNLLSITTFENCSTKIFYFENGLYLSRLMRNWEYIYGQLLLWAPLQILPFEEICTIWQIMFKLNQAKPNFSVRIFTAYLKYGLSFYVILSICFC